VEEPNQAFRSFFKRLRALGHRPPSGPLTTSEATDAEELRQETLAKDDEQLKREQRDARGESNSNSE
jgi:hypothetical protein